MIIDNYYKIVVSYTLVHRIEQTRHLSNNQRIFHGIEGMRRKREARGHTLTIRELRQHQADWEATAGIFAPTHAGLMQTGTSPSDTWRRFDIYTRVG